MNLSKKRLSIIAFITILILLIPLIGMNFSNEVNWSIMDFVIAFIMLFGTGLLIEFILRKVNKIHIKIALIMITTILFLLIWAQLAVGLL